MGSITIPTWVAYAAVAVSAAGAAYESHEQGVATQNMDKRKARVEAENATQKQIGMRQNMLRALATQNAAAGVGGGGVNKAGALRQLTEGQNDIMVNASNSSAAVSLLDQAGKNARSAGDIGAGVDVLGAAAKYPGGSAPPPSDVSPGGA